MARDRGCSPVSFLDGREVKNNQHRKQYMKQYLKKYRIKYKERICKIERICPYCSKIYLTCDIAGFSKKYCSKECSIKASKRRMNKICPLCKTTFSTWSCASNGRKYCSKKCRAIFKKGSIIKKCDTCLNPYKTFISVGNFHKYCSRKCSLADMPRKIKGQGNPNWQGGITPLNKKIRNSNEMKNWRKAVFKRDNWTCIRCKKHGGNLEADHIRPFALYQNLRFDINNGRTLCIDCHRKTNSYTGNKRYQLELIDVIS